MAELTVDDLHLAYGDNLILKGVSLTVPDEMPIGCCSALLLPTASAVMSMNVMLWTADVQRLDVSSEVKARMSSVLYSVKFLFAATSMS